MESSSENDHNLHGTVGGRLRVDLKRSRRLSALALNYQVAFGASSDAS
jgi:hypothetical protein